MNHQQKIMAARLNAVKKAPYLATALLAVVPREVPLGTLPCSPTMAMTDTGILVYEAACIDAWTVPQIGAVLIHEILHWLRDHGEKRRKNRDPRLWNMACDAEINDDLVRMKLDLPGEPILPSSFKLPDGLTAEEYYPHFKQLAKPSKGARKPGQGAGQGQPQDGQDNAQDGTPGQVGGGACGSCAGNPQHGEPTSDRAARSPAQQQAIRMQVAAAVREAVKNRGSVPLGLQRWAETALRAPQVPWQSKLARAVRTAVAYRPGATDYKFSRPSRRQGGIGYGAGVPVLPSLVTPVPNVAFVLDTSGSMGNDDCAAALSEANGVLAAVGAEITFIALDAAVHSNKRVRNIEELKREVKGGGGTDLCVGFDALEKMRPRPEVVIFATDGFGPAPALAPRGMNVVWLLIGQHTRRPWAAGTPGVDIAWGEFITIDKIEKEA